MKVLFAAGSYYLLPKEYPTVAAFAEYLNSSGLKFAEMVRFETDNCVHPYYIKEDIKSVYVNFGHVEVLEESDINVLSKDEYENRLLECVETVCKYCLNYHEDNEDNMKGHRDKINLDGKCFWKQDI